VTEATSGPLQGVRVVELAGIGPAPFGCMMLADLGAEVLRVERPSGGTLPRLPPELDSLTRNRRVVAADLKSADGQDLVLRLCAAADVLVEGFRPGVAERLGVGPDACCGPNPRLIYARMTGWGQAGPLAARAGHDITYAAIAGALGTVGEAGRKPVPPLNLVADFGGGGMFLVAGVLAALVERATSGRGQVVDVAMVDGTATLLAMALSQFSAGLQRPERGSNLLDGGAPFYDTYRCADDKYVAVGALESQFFSELVRVLDVHDAPAQWDVAQWPRLRSVLATAFAARPRDEWAAAFADVDACVAPVLGLDEVAHHPHLVERGTVVDQGGLVQPAPAPRFSRTPGSLRAAPASAPVSPQQALADWDC
jgi:alpha-methylacyl-CoA racemase